MDIDLRPTLFGIEQLTNPDLWITGEICSREVPDLGGYRANVESSEKGQVTFVSKLYRSILLPPCMKRVDSRGCSIDCCQKSVQTGVLCDFLVVQTMR